MRNIISEHVTTYIIHRGSPLFYNGEFHINIINGVH